MQANESTTDDGAAELARRITSRGHPFPLKRSVIAIVDELMGELFPQLGTHGQSSPAELAERLRTTCAALGALARPLVGEAAADEIPGQLLAALPGVHESALQDAEAILGGDPAAESLDEVISAYPGFLAIAVHRLAHAVHLLGVPIVPRLMAELAHTRSGVDIHPGATIGRALCIDHATGIVIGETAVIGDEVKLYQGVTLGALSVSKEKAGTKRHPTVGNRVVIYANATVLGGDTTIGDDCVIGGNVFLTSSVPAGSVVYQNHGYRVRRGRAGLEDTDFTI